jgi:prophage regulatory protein
MNKLPGKGYIRVTQLAPELSVSVPTLWRWAKSKKDGFPAPVRLSGRVTAWSISEVEAWLESKSRKGALDE